MVLGVGRYWEDDETWFGDYVDLSEGPPPSDGHACMSVPCPPFEDATVEVSAVCICHDLAPGQLYRPGCELHDPLVRFSP